MLRATVAAPWSKLVSASNVRTVVRPFFGSGLLVGKDGGIKTNQRSRDDEIMDQTSYSDAFDESDALEMGKEQKGVGWREHKDTSVSQPWMSGLVMDQTSYSDAFDESDALEMGKQQKGVGSSENKDTSVSQP